MAIPDYCIYNHLSTTRNPRQDMPKGLPFRLTDYLELVDWAGRVIRNDKRGTIFRFFLVGVERRSSQSNALAMQPTLVMCLFERLTIFEAQKKASHYSLPFIRISELLDSYDILSLRAFLALSNIELNQLTFS